MKIDNKVRAGKIRLFYMLIPFLIVLGAALIYLVTDTKNFIWAVIAGACLLVFFLVMSFFKLYYISFYAGPDKVRLRFKSLSPFPTQNNSIQIDSGLFSDYRIERKSFGIKKIVFYQNTPGGLAEYPKTSITALSDTEIDQMCKALDLIKHLNIKN